MIFHTKLFYSFEKNKVILVALPAHTSHKTQVLDASYFGTMKCSLKSLLCGRSLQISQGFKEMTFILSVRSQCKGDGITNNIREPPRTINEN